MIIYTCPKCGKDLQRTVLFSNPRQYEYTCNSCGFEKIERREITRVQLPIEINAENKIF